MNTVWNAEFKLYLYPENPVHQIDMDNLTQQLKENALLGESLSSNRYATGDNFLSLFTFMGCSPNIELEPQDDKPYCYIEIESRSKPHFIAGKNTKYPPCPHCKEKLDAQNCIHCNKSVDLTKINWRKSAFISSSWICVGNIYELEAIPNDHLLNALKNETKLKWKVAYIRESEIINIQI